jgi:hypothetical protein
LEWALSPWYQTVLRLSHPVLSVNVSCGVGLKVMN